MAEQTHQQHIVNADSIFINNRNDKKSSHIQIGTLGALGDNDLKLNNCNIEIVGDGFIKGADLRTTVLKDTAGNAAITLSGGNTLDFNTANIDFNDATITNFPVMSASNVSSANGFASLDAELDALTTNKLSITGHTASKLFVSSSGGGITTSSTSTSQLATAISNANSALQNFNGLSTNTITVGGGADKTSNVDFKFVATAMNISPDDWKYLTLRTPTLSADKIVVLPGEAGTLQLIPSEGAFANGDKTKLDAIEASADVTDTANVTAAGALMDSELTDLTGVKGVTISTLQVKPSEGAFANGDKTKLDAIEASADVTDTANVTAAGALMDSELTDLTGVKGVTISTLQVKPSEGAFANGDKTALDASVAKLTGISFGDVSPHTNATRIGQGTNQLIINNDNSVNSNDPDDGGFMEYNSVDFFLLRKPSATAHWNMIFDRSDRYWSGFRSTHHWDCYDGNGETGLGKYDLNCPGEVMYLQYYSHGNVSLCYQGGNVGIRGATSYPLQVNGSEATPDATYRGIRYADWHSSPPLGDMGLRDDYDTNDHSSGFTTTSIKAQYAIQCSGLLITSDRRIKENIREIDDGSSLEILRKLPCVKYEYIDKMDKGFATAVGFIAQDVKKHIPLACSLSKEFIPNELRTIVPVWEDISGQYKLIIDLSGTKYRFFCHTGEKSEDIDLENDGNGFIFKEKWENIFLYGEEVDDFHRINKEKIFSVAFSATQEIDRIQQQHVIEIANIKAELQREKNKTIYFEDKIREIEIRLSNANL